LTTVENRQTLEMNGLCYDNLKMTKCYWWDDEWWL